MGDRALNGMYLAAEPWMAVREEKKKELVGKIAEMDEIYLPIVGRKLPPPAQEEVECSPQGLGVVRC